MKHLRILAALIALACPPAFAQVTPGSGPATIAKGGTGRASLDAHKLVFGAGASPVTLYGCTGFLIGTGTSVDPTCRAIAGSDLPLPGASSLGGVNSITATSSQWLRSLGTDGNFTKSQPTFSDISGVAAASQLPNPTTSALGGVQSKTCTTSQWLNVISTGGVPACAQPAFSDVSGSAALSQLPAFSGMTAAAAVSDTDTVPTNQGAGNLKQTFAAIKTWVKGWIAKADVGLGNVDNTSDATKNTATATLVSKTFDTATNTFKLNGASFGTATQATAALNVVVGDSGSGGTKGLVPAPGAGDAAAGKFLKADGTYAVPPGTGGGGSGGSSATAPQGRLTLTSGVAITTSDVVGATSIYYTFSAGQFVPLYTSSFTNTDFVAELSLALDSTSGHTGYHQSGKNFDLFIVSDSGTIRLGTGPAWTSDTSRGAGAGTTELDFSKAYPTNKNSMTLRFGSASGNTITVSANQGTYVGSFRATADGQATDSSSDRLLYNAYNSSKRLLRRVDPATSSNWSTASFRQANANTANRVAMLFGLPGYAKVVSQAVVGTASGSVQVITGIGLDSSTANSSEGSLAVVGTSPSSFQAFYNGVPGLGYHELRQLEYGAGSGTQTWFYTLASVFGGLSGEVEY